MSVGVGYDSSAVIFCSFTFQQTETMMQRMVVFVEEDNLENSFPQKGQVIHRRSSRELIYMSSVRMKNDTTFRVGMVRVLWAFP